MNVPPVISTTSTLSAAAAQGTVPPRRSTLSPPPLSPRSKPLARELLRKHYGLNRAVSNPDSIPAAMGRSISGTERPKDPMDMDSPAFDPRAYYQHLIMTSSLNTLLQTENRLLTEIRQLDSERQSLVYNHHHELIEASDTIAAMKTRAESLDTDLDKLKAAFSEISRISSELGVEHAQPERKVNDRLE